MGFDKLDTPAGVKALNDFLATRSYIEGYGVHFLMMILFSKTHGPCFWLKRRYEDILKDTFFFPFGGR